MSAPAQRRAMPWRAAGLTLLMVTLGLAAVAAVSVAVTPAPPAFTQVRGDWRASHARLLDHAGTPLATVRLDFQARRGEWTTLAVLPDALVTALIAAEDRRFYRHRGVDLRALAGAARDALRGHAPRGASTLSMQLAALLDPALRAPAGRRSVDLKWRQMRAAWVLERHWRKPEILEGYLNLAGFRGELTGIGAAAQGLFGKPPAALDADESALLIALLPAPRAALSAWSARACRVRQATAPATDCAHIARLAGNALHAPRPVTAQAPDLAPQLAHRLLREPGETRITTLDAPLQRFVQATLRGQLSGLAGGNARDGAALVVDNASGAVLAYVGSAGPASGAAQVDGVAARRQAGSTLKPFLYALALERGYLTAASVLADTPIDLDTASGLYIPRNYAPQFNGPVSVRSALAASLNIPAVRALVLVGPNALRERLYALGYHGITHDGDHYGYALALGAPEVSLLEQVNAYRTLARGGQYTPLRFAPHARAPEPRPVMSAASAFVVADILADPVARALGFGADNPLALPIWAAVKTGTSKHMRDNWCIGFSDRYTVGVWVGNFEGDAMRDVSGVSGAAPAWAAIMARLHRDTPSVPPAAPAGVVAGPVRYLPAIEPPRREWFIGAAPAPEIRLAGAQAAPPRIVSPPSGAVLALDPDIPPAHQSVPLRTSGTQPGMRLVLNGRELGPARRMLAWKPVSGPARIELRDAAGRVLDAVVVQVRGAP